MPKFSPDEDRIVVEFEEDGDGCVMTFTQEGLSWPVERAADDKQESEEGWVEMFDNLAESLPDPNDEVETTDPTAVDPSDFDVTITRTFEAPGTRSSSTDCTGAVG